MSESERRSGASVAAGWLLAAAPVAVAGAVVLGSTRTWVSWHGFAHAAVSAQLRGAALPPENPFFAGEPLAHAWLHPLLGAALARAFGCDVLNALAALTLASLALLMFSALRLGARHYGSPGAGLLIGWLALAGLNPAGPGIATAKAVQQGVPLLEFATEPVETVFVSDESADLFMAHPLLRALHVSADWRQGQNLPWFLDNSPHGPALALLLPLTALLLARPRAGTLAASTALGVLTAALHPLVGLAGAGALLGGACMTSLAGRLPALRGPLAGGAGGAVAVGAAALLGALLAAPTYWPLFAAGAGAEPAALGLGAAFSDKASSMAASFCLLAPLACHGAVRAPARLRAKLVAIALGGLALVAAVPLLALPDGSEHNLANAAGVLLAVPALGFAAQRGLSRRTGTLLFAWFLPVTACTLASFSGRPPLPIASEDGAIVRTPAEHPLAVLYRWIRAETPSEAVFVLDPAHPVKMATNVSELPAFTGRALFVDQPSPLTTPHAELAERTQLAAALAAGEPLEPSGRESLVRLGRPVFLVSHAGDDAHLAARLTSHYGPPRFASGFVSVYAIAGAP